jgi:hypothetical protein
MENFKDMATTICGLVFIVCTSLLGVQTQVVLPKWVLTACIVGIAISGGLTMWLTGKNPDGSKKSIEQVVGQNTTAALDKEKNP